MLFSTHNSTAGENHRMEFGLFDDDFEDYNEPMSDESSFAESSEEEDQSTATARADETTYVSLEENERFVSTHSKSTYAIYQSCESFSVLFPL